MCLKSLAGSISVHGNLEDDKILYRTCMEVARGSGRRILRVVQAAEQENKKKQRAERKGAHEHAG